MGKTVPLRKDWEKVKLQVMETLVRNKFKDSAMKNMLLSTHDEDIQEGNYWHDSFWGVDLRTGQGENHLGKILMKVRDELK